MSASPDSRGLKKKKNRHSGSWAATDFWYSKDPQAQALKNVIQKLRLQSLSTSASNTPPSEPEPDSESDTQMSLSVSAAGIPDFTCVLTDELLLKVFSKLPRRQVISNSLVCKRWERLSGKLVTKIRILEWDFLESGRATYRFPNLIDVDMVQCCVKASRNSSIVFNSKWVSVHLGSSRVLGTGFLRKDDILDSAMIDKGVRILAEGCRNLGKIVVINVSEEGLNCLGEECEMLQEIELHCCDDLSLKGVSGIKNLQILRLIGCVDGIYETVISDIGLTILAQACRRLVKLELVGCEGSYDGIKAIGQCCQMLEELSFCDHRMDGGWLAALSYCSNLKTLKLQSCKVIDASPGPDEHLGCCYALEQLHLQRCHLHDKQGVRALFIVCGVIRELVLEDCWGLDNNTLAVATICRNIRVLSLEGCSLLTTEGVELVVLTWKQLTRLRVVSCNNIKDSEITPELAALFTVLKELKWRPDTKSMLSSALEGTGVGQKGGRSFRWK